MLTLSNQECYRQQIHAQIDRDQTCLRESGKVIFPEWWGGGTTAAATSRHRRQTQAQDTTLRRRGHLSSLASTRRTISVRSSGSILLHRSSGGDTSEISSPWSSTVAICGWFRSSPKSERSGFRRDIATTYLVWRRKREKEGGREVESNSVRRTLTGQQRCGTRISVKNYKFITGNANGTDRLTYNTAFW